MAEYFIETALLTPGLVSLDEKETDNRAVLQQALEAGLKAQERGEYFHPAANEVIDRMSDGVAGRLQLKSLIENGKLAGEIRVEG